MVNQSRKVFARQVKEEFVRWQVVVRSRCGDTFVGQTGRVVVLMNSSSDHVGNGARAACLT